MCRFRIRVTFLFLLALTFAQRAGALVYCVTNAVDDHQSAPTGTLADSGWKETVQITNFLATVIYSNALLTAGHIIEITNGVQFIQEGQTHTVTSIEKDAQSDLSVLFFTPPVTQQVALINIETNDINAFVVLQGRGMERGDVVMTDSHTNGWKWAWDKWWAIRRWGVNHYIGEWADDPVYAVAFFENNGDPDECMLSVGDSGGPGFIRTGGGWKLATVNSSVDPFLFTASTNSVSAFNASLFDCTGLYYYNYSDATWRYVSQGASPVPCLMINARTSRRVAWLTNTVAGLSFPADIGVAMRCETNRPTARSAAEGLWFEVVATNAGPYTAREVVIDLMWNNGIRLRDSMVTYGSFTTNRWILPALVDGGAATLRVDTVVWSSASLWVTNRASVALSDKPDKVTSNNTATCALWLPSTATRLLVD